MNYYNARIIISGRAEYIALGTFSAMTEDDARTQAWHIVANASKEWRSKLGQGLKGAQYSDIQIEQLFGMGGK